MYPPVAFVFEPGCAGRFGWGAHVLGRIMVFIGGLFAALAFLDRARDACAGTSADRLLWRLDLAIHWGHRNLLDGGCRVSMV